MSDLAQDFSYILCPGSQPETDYFAEYEKIYTCWMEVWSEAFAEIGITKALHSDAFSRQDYVGALLYQKECVGLVFFRWVNSQLPGFAADSYFANWSPQHLNTLCSRGNKIIVCSNFTVHSKFRRNKLGLSVKDLLCGLLVETFLHSDANGMTGAVRVSKGVNSLVERWGATPIDRNIRNGKGEDADTDLVAFFKDTLLAAKPSPEHQLQGLQGLVQTLWESHWLIPRLDTSREFKIEGFPPLRRVA